MKLSQLMSASRTLEVRNCHLVGFPDGGYTSSLWDGLKLAGVSVVDGVRIEYDAISQTYRISPVSKP